MDLDQKPMVFDIEANGLLNDATKIWCVCAMTSDGKQKWSWGPNDLVEAYEHLLKAPMLIAHNGVMYDIPVLERLVGEPNSLPGLPPVYDTLLISRLLYPDRTANPVGGHSLEKWGKYLDFEKLEYKDFTRWTPQMVEYCYNDVELTRRVYRTQYPEVLKFPTACQLEHQVASIIQDQIQRGFLVNRMKLDNLEQKIMVAKAGLADQIQKIFPPETEEMKTPEFWIAGDVTFPTKKLALQHFKASEIERGPNRVKVIPFNPDSGMQLADRLKKQGWKPKDFTPTGVPVTSEAVLSELVDRFDGVREVLQWQMLTKREGQLAQWREYLNPKTNRIHGDVITNGAVTGRMTHNRPNMAQIPSVGAPLGRECRELFCVPPGKKLVGIDASGLEARMLAHYMAEWDDGRYAKVVTESDIHTYNQEMAGLDSRAQTKTMFYGFLYGAGDTKLASIIGSKRASDGKRLRERFLKNIPAMAKLVKWVQKEAKIHGGVVGLDGRWIPVRSEHSALNTLLQGAGAVVMKMALVILSNSIKERRYDGFFVANIHDEWEIECPESEAEDIGQMGVLSIKKAGEIFGLRCPLDGEYKIGTNWAECH